MNDGKQNSEIVRVRNEVLVALKMIYPASLQADQLFRALLSVFPTLEWVPFRRDLCYLIEKGYLQRVIAGSESEPRMTPFRKRWLRVTPSGLEITDKLIGDPALQE